MSNNNRKPNNSKPNISKKHWGEELQQYKSQRPNEEIRQMSVSELKPFEAQPFKVLMDDSMDELVQSIKESGVLHIPVDAVSDNVQPIQIVASNISIKLPASVTPQLLQTAIEALKC